MIYNITKRLFWGIALYFQVTIGFLIWPLVWVLTGKGYEASLESIFDHLHDLDKGK